MTLLVRKTYQITHCPFFAGKFLDPFICFMVCLLINLNALFLHLRIPFPVAQMVKKSGHLKKKYLQFYTAFDVNNCLQQIELPD